MSKNNDTLSIKTQLHGEAQLRKLNTSYLKEAIRLHISLLKRIDMT